LQASLGRPGRWRRFWGEVALGLPALLALMSSFPHKRAPLPGESFYPSDLEFGWWALLKTVVVWGVPAGLALWAIASGWRGGGLRAQAAEIAVDGEQLRVVFDDHSVPIALDRIENVYRDGEPVLEYRRVSSGPDPMPPPRIVAPHQPDAPLVVELGGGEQLMVRGEPEQLAELERVLTPEPERRVARFEIGSVVSIHPLVKLMAWLFFLWSYAFALAGIAGLGEALGSGVMPKTALVVASLLSFVIVAGMWPLLRRRRLEVGIDGVRIDGIWRRRFVGHHEISAVHDEGAVRLRRHHGRSVHIPVAKGPQRVAAAIEAAHEARERLAVAELEGLERGARDAATWRRDMEALREERGYRKKALRIEQLEELLNDPTAPPDRRVGAALAIRGDDAQRKRIEQAAAASADADLRAALEAAAEGEVAEVELARAQRRHHDR
jgi:hypothetical protein